MDSLILAAKNQLKSQIKTLLQIKWEPQEQVLNKMMKSNLINNK